MDNIINNHKKTKQDNCYKQIIGVTLVPDETKYPIETIELLFETATQSCADYTFYPEYRDNINKLGLHYHGIIKIYDKVKWFKRGKPIMDKGTNMKPRYEINISGYWYTYITKDQPIDCTDELDIHPIKHNDLDYGVVPIPEFNTIKLNE